MYIINKMINTIVNYVNFYYPITKKILNNKNIFFSESFIKSALIYRYLYEVNFKKNINIENILYILNDTFIKSNSRVLNNHLIFYKAFKSFYDRYKIGRGCVYVFDSPIKSEVLGYLTGILYWIFHKGLI